MGGSLERFQGWLVWNSYPPALPRASIARSSMAQTMTNPLFGREAKADRIVWEFLSAPDAYSRSGRSETEGRLVAATIDPGARSRVEFLRPAGRRHATRRQAYQAGC